jgi:hypothetical protein
MRRLSLTFAVVCLCSTAAVAWGAAGTGLRGGGKAKHAARRHHHAAHADRQRRRKKSTHRVAATFVASAAATGGSGSDPVLFGDQQVETSVDTNAPGMAEAFPFTGQTSGTAQTVSVYVDPGNRASAVFAGIYTNVSGHPGSLLTTGSLPAPHAGAWNTISVTGASVAAGTTYWVAILGRGGYMYFRDRAAGPCRSVNSSQSTLAALPASWTSGARWNTCPVSAYVSGTAASPPATTTTTTSTTTTPTTTTTTTTTTTPTTTTTTTPTTTTTTSTTQSPPPPPPPPSNTSPPAISGSAVQGNTLTASAGSWSGSPTSYAYHWQHCASGGTSCTDIPGATAASYVLQSSDVGDAIEVAVTATNNGGSTSASSAPTGTVAAQSPTQTQTLNCFASPMACGYPDPAAPAGSGAHVGPSTSCSSLPQVNGNVTSSSNGQTIQNETINGQLTIRNSSVTVNNVCVIYNGGGVAGSGTTAVHLASGSGILIENSTIAAPNSTTQSLDDALQNGTGNTITLDHDYVHDCSECLHDWNWTVTNSYISTDSLPAGTPHTEDIYVDDGATLNFQHDTLFNFHDETALIFMDNTGGGACTSSLTVQGSLLAGGGYMIYSCGGNKSSHVGSGAYLNVQNNHLARCLTAPVSKASDGGSDCGGLTGTAPGDGEDSHGFWPFGGHYGPFDNDYCPPTIAGAWANNVWDDSGATVGC